MNTEFSNRLVVRLQKLIEDQGRILITSAGLNPTEDRYVCGTIRGLQLALAIADEINKQQNAVHYPQSVSNANSQNPNERTYDV